MTGMHDQPATLIADAFRQACRAELTALKPGNVHIHAAGHGMEIGHFKAAADAAAPRIAAHRASVGHRIHAAATASFAAAGCNTNLGIVLLCAPLAHAAEALMSQADFQEKRSGRIPGPSLREALRETLHGLTRDDARLAFDAIAKVNPAGLGEADEADVRNPPDNTLREAMALAADRDRIARAYVTDFADLYDFGLPLLRAAIRATAGPDLAITKLHMACLAAFEDSHIARKHGSALARDVRREARDLAAHWEPNTPQAGLPRLLEYDANLKARGLNPGTTADLVVATIFANSLEALSRV